MHDKIHFVLTFDIFQININLFTFLWLCKKIVFVKILISKSDDCVICYFCIFCLIQFVLSLVPHQWTATFGLLCHISFDWAATFLLLCHNILNFFSSLKWIVSPPWYLAIVQIVVGHGKYLTCCLSKGTKVEIQTVYGGPGFNKDKARYFTVDF